MARKPKGSPSSSPVEVETAPNSQSAGVSGVPIPPDVVEIFKRFRGSFLPDARITAQETYAKWLFGLTTTIAALGTGFSNTAFSKLSGWGDVSYAIAVLAAGLGLGLAAWALSEELQDANWESVDAMVPVLVALMHKKKNILRGATTCVFVSFVAAAAAPLITTIQVQPSSHPSGVTARISGRTVEAGISLTGLRPGTQAWLEVYRRTPPASQKQELLAAFAQIADDSGKINYKAPEFKLSSVEQAVQLVLTYERDNQAKKEEKSYTIPAETPLTSASAGVANTGAAPANPPSKLP